MCASRIANRCNTEDAPIGVSVCLVERFVYAAKSETKKSIVTTGSHELDELKAIQFLRHETEEHVVQWPEVFVALIFSEQCETIGKLGSQLQRDGSSPFPRNTLTIGKCEGDDG